MFLIVSPSAIVPLIARLAVGQGPPPVKDRLYQKTDMLPGRVKVHLASGSDEGMTVKNHDLSSRLPRQLFQPLAQINFFRSEQLMTESAYFSKRRRVTENKRPGHELVRAADPIPDSGNQAGDGIRTMQFDRATAGQTFSGLNLQGHLSK